jgi:hypothetical protein
MQVLIVSVLHLLQACSRDIIQKSSIANGMIDSGSKSCADLHVMMRTSCMIDWNNSHHEGCFLGANKLLNGRSNLEECLRAHFANG